jgi:hypothetical protein
LRLEKLLLTIPVYISAFAIVGISLGPLIKKKWGKTKTSIWFGLFSNGNLYYNKEAYSKINLG